MMNERVQELKELIKMKEELEAQINAIQDEIKADMEDLNTDEIHGDGFSVTYKLVVTHRIDTKAFKKNCPKMAEKYTVESTYRRLVLK